MKIFYVSGLCAGRFKCKDRPNTAGKKNTIYFIWLGKIKDRPNTPGNKTTDILFGLEKSKTDQIHQELKQHIFL